MAKFGKLTKSLSKKTPQATHQQVQTAGTVMNNAGGFVYQISMWDQLERFLVLGNDGATYYVSEEKMTLDNAKNVIKCIKENGHKVVDTIIDFSVNNRAPKNDPSLFALALCASEGDVETKQYALSNLHKIARISTHLFKFAHYVDGFRGWGSGLRNAVAAWYNNKNAGSLAMQVIKYPKRTAEEGNSKSSWSHKDLLRKAHPTGDANHNLIYNYITKDGKLPKTVPSDLKILEGANLIKEATTEKEVVQLIEKYELPHEVIPKEFADKKAVWEALLPNMPMTATLRTLNRLTSYGVLAPLSSNTKFVIERLTNADEIQKARVHPIAVLAALKTYSSGRGIKGGLTWNPIPQISNALDEMLYMAFDAVEPTGKNILIGLDISGSMDMGGIAGLDFITPREGAAVMAMVTARSEKNYHMIAFTSGGGNYNGSSGVTVFNVSPKDRLDTVVDRMKRMDMGRTDCAIPPMYALKNKLDVDAFITLTDNETYDGSIKPSEAVNRYRKERNKPTAKMLAVGMTATEYSIADPSDKYSLNFVGFDSSAPSLMADFIRKP